MPPNTCIKYKILLSNGESYINTVKVEPRLEEMHDPSHYVIQTKLREFSKSNSVFANWRIDTKNDLRRMILTDYNATKIKNLINSETEFNEVIEIFINHASKLKELFISMAAKSAYPYASRFLFNSYLKKKNILGSACTLSDVDRYFIATTLGRERESNIIDSNFNRSGFFEMLVRIANRKYRETFTAKTYPASLSMLMKQLFHKENFGISSFRETKIWQLNIDDLIKGNLEEIKLIFNSNAIDGKYLAIKNIINIVKVKCELNISEHDIINLYGISKMTVINEAKEGDAYGQMIFEEFLEFLVRLAVSIIPSKSKRIDDQLSGLLSIMLPKYGLVKKPAFLPENE